MIRRLKVDVMSQLPSKQRQVIELDPSVVGSKWVGTTEFVIEVDRSLGQFKSAKLKNKKYTINVTSSSSISYGSNSEYWPQSGNIYSIILDVYVERQSAQNFPFLLFLLGKTRLGWDKLADQSTWPYPANNGGQT